MMISRPRQAVYFTALTILFALLSYVGAVLYQRAGGVTTVKPYSGVALALILIYGRKWTWPVVVAGTLGGILAKEYFGADWLDSIIISSLTSALLLAMDRLCARWIGPKIDFRAWKQLVGFIAIALAVGAVSGLIFAFDQALWWSTHLWRNWQAWFVSVTLSYVGFTPVMVLLATMQKGQLRENWRRLAGGFAILAAALASTFLPIQVPMIFVLPLALLLITMISDIEGAALSLAIIELVLTTATALGRGPAAIAGLSLGYQLYFVQVLISVMIAVILPAAAAITERRKLKDRLEDALAREAHVNLALRESERRALRLADEAQRANHAKSEFLASMSHELRTPLNAILGFSEIIRAQLYGPLGHGKYAEYADHVHRSGSHLLDLINDVLDLSKIDAGKMELRESVFAVDELIDDCVMLLREKAKDHVRLEIHTGASVRVRADQRLIKQILINLLSNAIKFTPAGGSITMGMAEKTNGLEIYVSDSGIGMTALQIEKAFSLYGQVDSRVARTHQGTGLGLPISQSLARLHDGDLYAQSTPGQGTRMALFLPESRILRAGSCAA
ncbi:MAG TPA: ATP-binding protein [Rhizomicrobium sp.]|nr:ATP-binding protein [Rhizomicrobium sp.]